MHTTRMFKTAFASALLLSAMAVRPAAAQLINLAKVNLPFEVTVDGVAMPAGQYTILCAREDSGSPVLMFRSDKGKTIEVLAKQIPTPDASASNRTEVVIGARGEQHDVEQLWIAGQATGYEFTR